MTRHIKRGGKVWINVFPRQARHPEAGRDPHGLGQGQPGALGRRREAGPRAVRAVRRRPESIAREAMRPAIQKLPIKARFVVRGGGVLMAKTNELRDLERHRAARPAGRGEGRAVQPALPARHRPARQHRTARRTCARRSPASTPSCASVRSRPPRRWRPRGDGVMADETRPPTSPSATRARCARASSSPTSMDKTVVVAVTDRVRHPRYSKTRPAHQASSTSTTRPTTLNVGDRVRVAETRPLSKLKRWRLVEVLERAR